ncbi:MAG: hypothetical protein R3248_12455 [Candidatus Promineifilaceae bacterium]|nr:hypothetical protein [Candidatus Promineifilaceae bacterium]
MRKRPTLLLTTLTAILLALLAVGCGAAAPSAEPTETPPPLPSATSLPTTAPAEGNWAVAFTHTFEPDFWAPGGHRYGFRAECPAIDYELASEWQLFTVSEEQTSPDPRPVYLRLRGLSVERFAPSYAPDAIIHPGQETTAILWIVGLSEEQAREAASGCEALIGWDQRGFQPLTAEEPIQPDP